MRRFGPAAALAIVSFVLAVSASAQQNLGFELGATDTLPLGWTSMSDLAPGAAVVDASISREGLRSLRLEGSEGTRIVQRISLDALRASRGAAANRIVLRAWVRGGAASVFLRLDGPLGPLFIDSRTDGRDSPIDDRGWRQLEVAIPLPDDATELTFGAVSRDVAPAWLDAFELDLLDTSRAAPPAASASRYLAAALDLIERNALRRNAVDWSAIRADAQRQARGAKTSEDTYHAIRLVLRALGDGHSYLLSPRAARALATAPVANARTGREAVQPSATALGGGAVYLAVPGFAGGTPLQQVAFANSLQRLIENHVLSAMCGWILDLRMNSGGNLWPMLAGLGPLLGEGELGVAHYPDGRRTAFWYEGGKAGFGDYVQLRVSRAAVSLPALPPVAVLIGRGTASSAEVLVAALRGREEVRTFGAPTRGLSAGNRTFDLADGAALVLTVAATADRRGWIYTGPIAPDEPVTIRTAESAGVSMDDEAVRAAAAWLRSRPYCEAERLVLRE